MGSRDPKGYYAILSVDNDADGALIKAAYRRRAMELHPDRNASAGATSQFQHLIEAYAVLSQPASRAEYDTKSVKAPEEVCAEAVEAPEPIVCSCCGKVSAQPRYVIFLKAKSFLVFTVRSMTQGVFCSPCAEKKALQATAITWALGWWGFPWGPIYSVQALWVNMLGGKRPVMPNARLAAQQARFFAATGRPDMARAVALDALGLAQKIPRKKNSDGSYVDDEGAKLRVHIETFLDALGGSSVRLRNAWKLIQRRFFVQLGAVAVMAAGISSVLLNAQTNTYAPPVDPKSYVAEATANVDYGKQTSTAEIPSPNAVGTSSTRQPVAQGDSTNAGTPVVKQAWIRPPKAPNGQPWPRLASYLKGLPQTNAKGLSTVTIDNGQNSSDVFVKLVSLNGKQAKPARFVFIPAHGRFTAKAVTPGRYDLRYRDLVSGYLSRSEPFKLEEKKTARGTKHSDLTLTLYKVQNGNMTTYNLAEDEF
ncbi:J domain-containing protein [Pseudomonas sp. MDT1-17]